MAIVPIEIRKAVCQPTDTGADKTVAIPVRAGERVVFAGARLIAQAAAASDSTFTLGDDADPDGYVAAIDPEATAVGTLVAGEGALLANSGGKLYTADDTVDLTYNHGTVATGSTKPKAIAWIGVVNDLRGL